MIAGSVLDALFGDPARLHPVACGISVRPAESFPGLGPDHIRVAVRRRADKGRLVSAQSELES